ncbi:hypothetical protein B0J13DRAFT_584460 [Dactylonectria estremocensis]|uniref:Uncharacterized protein n=1 Tax=Dactylonectria estremocensis TaxID=1079267 RepID=A0A9P9J9F2_9HYPO|nr:hypothetical protein B0J13DRAFT_584460 [Dactylonectria estremocensis]
MQEHCSKEHHWENPRSRGRPITGCTVSSAELPWIEGVACQRFFPSRAGSRWFEHNYQEEGNQPHVSNKTLDPDSFTSMSLWLDRTQWQSTYRNVRRDVLRASTRLPDRRSLMRDFVLGQGSYEGDSDIISPREDEQKISCIMGALDLVIDRCENTVRHTSRTILCWLLSARLQYFHDRPFSLVAEKNSEKRYRFHRMPTAIREKETNISLGSKLSAHLKSIWNHQNKNYCSEKEEEEGEGEEDADNGDDDDEEDWDAEFAGVDQDDSGYTSDYIENDGECQFDLPINQADEVAIATFNKFLELLFQVYLTIYTETFIDGRPDSTLLVYFSGILGFSGDCRQFLLAKQYCSQLSGLIYMQRVLLLEHALPLQPYTTIGITRCPQAQQLERFSEMLAGGLCTACGQSPRAKFCVARFLPSRLRRVIYKYLVYIRRLAALLRREQSSQS